MSAMCALPKLRARALVSALPDVLAKSCEQDAFQTYVAECMRMISENSAKFGGNYMSASLNDILHPKPKDTRTGDEIAADIIKRAGLKVV